VRERFPVWGDTLFWGCLITSTALLIVSLAQPRVVASTVRRAGVDLVVLLDGSASMHVRDVEGNRWQRSIRFLRALGDSLGWDDDRMALTLFAHIAAPQVRLTRDPNTFFFFLDHLRDGPPFRLEDDTSWDTNIALGIEWGLRLIEKDEELRGKSPNAKQFVLLTDGQAFSGVVEDALKLTRARDVPIFVVGVGSLQGGVIPDPKRAANPEQPIIRSALDRASLTTIATRSGGRYLELDRDGDVAIANQIIDAARRRSVTSAPEPAMQPVYWQFLFAAACLAVAAVVFLRDRSELWIQAVGAGVVLMIVGAFLR
jgi:Ca-activated chloride channel family protein